MTVAAVNLWGRRIGAVSVEGSGRPAVFQYDEAFAGSGIEVSPISMPLRRAPYTFPALNPESFRGLPGLLADSLPDTFGNALIDVWLRTQGRAPGDFDAVERLCYTGARGMGALEFAPAGGPRAAAAQDIEVDALVRLASEILSDREEFSTSLGEGHDAEGLRDILRVGTSAGGARAKAVIAFDPETGAVRSGQVDAGPGFQHWLLKFDGVRGNRDKELDDPQGYGAIEYAYALMAGEAGIQMAECRLLEERGRRHFMTRRFDRSLAGHKIHMQSLGALAHFDLQQAGANSYEQAFAVMRRLDLGMDAIEEQFRRMVFNIVARNQDDHVKNIAYLMDQRGRWWLSPAFDVTYAYNPSGAWTGRHQMSVGGKREHFAVEDLRACARTISMKSGRADRILAEVRDAVGDWGRFASVAGVERRTADSIAKAHRMGLGRPL